MKKSNITISLRSIEIASILTLVLLIFLLVFFVIYYRNTQSELERQENVIKSLQESQPRYDIGSGEE